MIFLLSTTPAWSASLTWVGTGANDDFNTAANWSPAQIPTSSDTCTINSTSSRQPSILASAFCGSLTLGTGGTVMTLTYATQNLTISGDVTIGTNGRVTASGTPTGTFTIGGNWSDPIGGAANFTNPGNLQLSYNFTGTSKTIASDESFWNTDIKGSYTLNSGFYSDNSLLISNAASLTQGANTITLAGTSFTINGSYIKTCNSVLDITGSYGISGGNQYPVVNIKNGGTLTGANGSFIDCDFTIENGGTFDQGSASMEFAGNWTRNTGSTYTYGGTGNIIMTGAGKQITGTIATQDFPNLTIGNGSGDSVTVTANLQLNTILYITAGATLTLQAGQNITTSDKVENYGSIYVSGTTTWSHVTGNNKQLRTYSGGLLSVQGTNDANRITMTRIGAVGNWDLVADGGIDLDYVNLNYTKAASPTAGISLNTPNGQTLGFDYVTIHNVEDVNGTVMIHYGSPQTVTATYVNFWKDTLTTANDFNVEATGGGTITFASYGGDFGGESWDKDTSGSVIWAAYVISGTVYTDEGVTNIGSGKTIRLIKNGADAGSTTTNASGQYSIAPAALSAGDAMLVYIDGDATYKGSTVTVSNGASLSGLNIYAGHIITRHDNAGSLSNANMSTAKGAYSDADIEYSVSAGNLTISGSTTELYVPTGHGFAPGGNVTTPNMESLGTFNGGTGSIDSNGNLIISSGSFTASSGTTFVGGNYTLSTGTFTHNNGTVVFDGTNQTITGSTTFNNLTKSVASAATLTFAAGSTTTINGTATLNGASGQLLSLRSSATPTKWNFVLGASATKAISYVDVMDSDASGSAAGNKPIAPASSTNSGNNIDWFSGQTISGKVFEDANFTGTAANYVNETEDKALTNVDVELYTNADAYISSATTDASGNYSFTGLADGTYKVRARSATIGDADTAPKGTTNACVPATCAYPLPEMSWGNGAALYGGQSATVDDTATGNNAGPGDTYVSVTVSGANISNVNFGFVYNLIVNKDNDSNADTVQSKQGSLRQFIKNANAIGTAGGTTANSSQFRIPAGQLVGGVAQINVATALPSLSDASGGTSIDGNTQTVNQGDSNLLGPEIEIYCSACSSANALTITSNNNVLKGIVIDGPFNIAVSIAGNSNTVSQCYIGTDATGTTSPTVASGNKTGFALYISAGASSNMIGGATAADRNVLSGTSSNTIWILNSTTQLNTIRNNYIGTTAAGTAVIPNAAPPNAIVLTDATHDNTIQENVISGNATGIYVDGLVTDPTLNVIKGNYIGTNAAGSAAIANSTGIYVLLGANNTTIGGTTAADRNIISGNTTAGIVITDAGSTSNVIKGNYIGTNAAGTGAIANGQGIQILNGATSNTVGGTSSSERNIIAANSTGIQITGASNQNTIAWNYIGADANGAALANTADGISVATATNITIQANLIRSNGGDGIDLTTSGTGSTLYHNTIHNNTGHGLIVGNTSTIIRNNIITGNGGYGINRVAAGMTETYNDVTDAATTPANASGRSNVALDATDLNANPLYTNAATGDFTLQAASPAINRGCNLGAAGDDTTCDTASDGAQPDVNGASAGNYNGYAPDMGAYESSITSTCPVSVATDGTAPVPWGSLRDCITYANNTAGADTISFSIGGCPGGLCTITPVSVLPTLSDATGGTTIDGYTQSGAVANSVASPGASNAVLNIQLSGGGASYAGITLSSASNVVKGLVINGFSGASTGFGINITGATATGNTVSGNYLGTNATGTAAAANYIGVNITSGAQSNTVGGTTPADRNLLSGNSNEGIDINGATTSANVVKGNYIGTDVNGTVAIGNAFEGVALYAPSSIIGGATAAERNIISGNSGHGLVVGGLNGLSNVIKGNWIGVNVNATSLPNAQSGIRFNINSNSNTVGGTSAGEGNTIAFNTVNGINIASTGNQILGNTIYNNTQDGIKSSNDNQTIAMNLIRDNGSGGNFDGIRLAAGSTNAKVYHNTIHANGSAAGSDGISVEDTGAIIRNNIITGQGYGYGINRVAASMTESYNLVTDASTTPANSSGQSNVSLDATDINANPLYVNAAAGNFALTECTSPAINAGLDLGGDQPDMNGAGAGSYNGYAPDMGALEAAACALSLSGTVYTDEGVTNIGAGKTIRVLVNGLNRGTTATAAGGTYAITTTYGAGDALLVYIDGNDGTTSDATTTTVSPSGNLSGVDLYVDHLITRHDNAGSQTNALMSTAKGTYSDTEILYSVSAGNLTVSGAATELYVPTGHSFAPGGDVSTPNMESVGTFSGGAGFIDINGALVISGGAYTATSGVLEISTNFTISAGSYTHNSGTLRFASGSTSTVNVGAAIFNHLVINKTNWLSVTGSMDVNGDITIASASALNNGSITVAGNVTTTDSTVDGNTTLIFDGTGAQLLSASGGSGDISDITISKASGTLTVQDTIGIADDWTYTSGTVDTGSSSIIFESGTATAIDSGPVVFNHVTFDKTNNVTITGTMDINGNLTFTSATSIASGTITVAGNVSSADIDIIGSTALTLDGTGAQSINTGTGDLPDGTLTINKASGTASLAANLTLNSAGQDLTVTAGTLDLAGFNLVLTGAGDVLTVSSGATLQLQGGETVTASTKTLSAGSTVIFNGAGSYGSLVMGNTYHHLTFNGTGTWTQAAALDVNGNLTISNGTLDASLSNYGLNVAGNWGNAGTYAARSGTVTFDGTNQSISGTTTFFNLTKSVAAAETLTFPAGATQTVNGLLTLNGASGQLLSLRSSVNDTEAFLTLAGGGSQSISYVDVKDNDAGGGQTLVAPNSVNSLNNTNWDFGLLNGKLVKQVYDLADNCVASSDISGGADSCNGNNDTITAPSGSKVKFLIYVRNTSAVASSDVRFQDLLDDSGGGFTYVANSMKYSDTQTDVATASAIFSATEGGTAQTDAVGAPDDYASILTGPSPDQLTLGAVAGQANQVLNIPGNRTFAILFEAIKN